jgi:phosphoribosyl 1,2-cyclic phosphodiesterase
MGSPDAEVSRALSGVHALLLEFNHDAAMLAGGPYSPALKRRVAGPRGHLSNEQAAEVLRAAAAPPLHTVVLAHLSATNNTPELALAAARGALERGGLGQVRVVIAEQDRIGPNLEV